jgi:hypothetical protein
MSASPVNPQLVIAQRSLVRQAYEMGVEARGALGIRVSPFYNERVLIKGRRLDITPLLDTFFFAGFDGEPYPEQDKAQAEVRSDVEVPAESN